MAAKDTISAVVPFLVGAAAGMEGVSPASIFAAVGVGGQAPPPAEDHVPIEAYFEAWRRALALIPDAAFPLRASEAFQLEDHELFGFLAISCQTLGQAYEKTAAYRALYASGARWELEVDDTATRLHWVPWPGDVADEGYRAAMDYAVVDMAHAIRRLGRTQPRPVAVSLRHAAPAEVAPFTEAYGVAPAFGRPAYELVYAPGLTELPIASFNSKLRDYFEEECRRIVAKLGAGTSLVDQVRKKLVSLMDGGDTSIEAVARSLGMSSRSLQRRLSDEGTGYNDLLAGIRAEFAKRYLSRRTLSASEVAYLIGFTEPPAFFKAFKRWTGMTPREFQQGAW